MHDTLSLPEIDWNVLVDIERTTLLDVFPRRTLDNAPNSAVRHSELVGDRADGSAFSSPLLDESGAVFGEHSSHVRLATGSTSLADENSLAEWHVSPRRSGEHRVERRALDAEIARDLSDRVSVVVHLTRLANNPFVQNCKSLVYPSSSIFLIRLYSWRHIFPRLIRDDLISHAFRALKKLSKLFQRHASISHLSHFNDLKLFEICHMVTFSTRRASPSNHVTHIVCMSANSEIVRIDVKRDIQLMENKHSRRYWSNEQCVRRDMSAPQLVVSHQSPVSANLWSTPEPRSSFLWWILWHVVLKSIVETHSKILNTHNHIVFISYVNVQNKLAWSDAC